MGATAGSARYTRGEEIANSVTHGVGLLLSIAGLSVLVTLVSLHAGARAIVAATIFGVTLILTYAASTLYHALGRTTCSRVLRVLDHAAIYLLIAGTYTPFTLVTLRGSLGWGLFGVIWTLAVVGIVVTAVAMRQCKVLSMVLYVGMGWMVAFAAGPFIDAMSTRGFVLVIAGGLSYTFGLVFYGLNRMPYNHSIWHLFVLGGSICHFLAILAEMVPGK